MARKKTAASENGEQYEDTTRRQDHGDGPALATKGKARAAGNLDVIRGGAQGGGNMLTDKSKPLGKGLRVESDKSFQFSADDKPAELVRVFDAHPENKGEDVVIFSGSRKQAERVHAELGKFLKK